MIVNEITAVEKYFQKNPEKLQSYDFPLQASAEEFKHHSALYVAKEKLDNRKKQLANKWIPLLEPITINGTNFLSQWKIKWKELDVSRNFEYAIKNLPTYDKFVKEKGKPEDPEQDLLLRKYYSSFRKDFIAMKNAESALNMHQNLLTQKHAKRAGIAPQSYDKILSLVKYYTSESGRKIPKEAKEALQKATVVPKELPKYVYRGMFYDGAKIKDRDKFLKKWYPGSKPGAKFAKPSSWSTSPAVAVSFMDAQDMVKDQENGFAIMLRYTITDPNMVLADLRNLPETTFWNQQEIILDPEVTDYEVLHILPYEKGKEWDQTELFKLQSKLGRPAAGAFGYSKREILLQQYFYLPFLEISPILKEKWKSYANLTAKEVKEKEHIAGLYNPEYEGKYENLKFPLYVLVNKYIGGMDIRFKEAIDENSMVVTLRRMMPASGHTETPMKTLVSKILEKPKWDAAEVGYNNYIECDAVITLVSTSGNIINFDIKDVKNVRVADFRNEIAKEPGARKIHIALRTNPPYRKEFFDIMKQEVKDSNSNSTSIAKFRM